MLQAAAGFHGGLAAVNEAVMHRVLNGFAPPKTGLRNTAHGIAGPQGGHGRRQKQYNSGGKNEPAAIHNDNNK